MIFFKAEANHLIGGGHLYRALALAKKLRERNIPARFIFTDTPKIFRDKVIQAGFDALQVAADRQMDPEFYFRVVPAGSLIIFDTDDARFYSGRLIDNLRAGRIKTACFTVTDQYMVTTDLLINPNIISKLHQYKIADHTKKILGPKYMLFRDEFRNVQPPQHTAMYPVNLLLIFGNSDTNHLTLFFLDMLQDLKEYFKKVHVVCGINNPDIEEIRLLIRSWKKPEIALHVDLPEMVPVYRQTDIGITSAGMAMWEMALFNIRQFVFAAADREVSYTDYLHDLQYIVKIGAVPEQPVKATMLKNLLDALENKRLAELKTDEFRSVIHPGGIDHIIDFFIELINDRR